MAVGDVIVAHLVTSLQPAVGVEIVVTTIFTNNVTIESGITQASDSTTMMNKGLDVGAENSLFVSGGSWKLGITNAHYWYSSIATGGMTGIQIK